MKKIRDKYDALSIQVKASIWFAISNIVQKGVSLLTTPIFTRLLSTEQYGIYSVYQSWTSIIFIFATLNLYSGVYNNGLTKWNDDKRAYTSSMIGLSSLTTFLCIALYICFFDDFNSIFKISPFYIILILVESLFTPAFNFWAASERYNYQYRKLTVISLLTAIISPLIGVAAVLTTGYKAEARALSSAIIQICVGLYFYFLQIYKGKKLFVKEYWIFVLRFNIPLIPHYLSQTVLNQADRIMISNMVGDEEAAIYSVAYSIAMMFTIITNAINNTFIPYTYKSLKNKDYNNLCKNSTSLVILITVGCTLAICFGPEIIYIFAAPQYYDARWVIPPTAESLIFIFECSLFCNIEFYFEKTGFIMISSIIAAVANIFLNYVGIKKYGYIAAAYTTLVCYVMMAIAHYIAYKIICIKYKITKNIYNIYSIVLCSIISISLMTITTLLYDHMYIRYVLIIMFAFAIYYKRDKIVRIFKDIK